MSVFSAGQAQSHINESPLAVPSAFQAWPAYQNARDLGIDLKGILQLRQHEERLVKTSQ